MLEAAQQIAKLIADGSGWVLFAGSWVLFAYGFHKGWWVPGWAHDREVARGDRAEDAIDNATKTTHEAAAATKLAADAATAAVGELAAWRRAVEIDRGRHESL